MKHLLILISFLLLSSPVIGQSSKYESVNQCVLQTMEDRKLTGNDMFKMVKEECERSLGEVTIEEKKNGILFRDSPFYKFLEGGSKWYKTGDEKTHGKYEGDIVNGIPNGRGIHTYPDGRRYEGEFKDGKMTGQGTFTLLLGHKYVGGVKDNSYHGQGTYTYPDGRKYVGEWKDNERHGEGVLTFPSGQKYIGGFKNGKMDGVGKLFFVSGGKYIGEFKNGSFHGLGTWSYLNGEQYEGLFRFGKISTGVRINKNGDIIQRWINGKETN